MESIPCNSYRNGIGLVLFLHALNRTAQQRDLNGVDLHVANLTSVIFQDNWTKMFRCLKSGKEEYKNFCPGDLARIVLRVQSIKMLAGS